MVSERRKTTQAGLSMQIADDVGIRATGGIVPLSSWLLGVRDLEPAAEVATPPHIPESLEKWSFHLGDASRSLSRYAGVGDADEIPSSDEREPAAEREEEELGAHEMQLRYYRTDGQKFEGRKLVHEMAAFRSGFRRRLSRSFTTSPNNCQYPIHV